MGEQRNGAFGPGDEVAWTALLPDLTGVDLRTLRAMDDPGLIAAVDHVLRGSVDFQEVWYSETDPEPVSPGGTGGRQFSAGLVDAARGEDQRE
ncbi:hypothetical protein ACWEKM_44485 [Streptomyces sp. NPDC004752]